MEQLTRGPLLGGEDPDSQAKSLVERVWVSIIWWRLLAVGSEMPPQY
jgi:hypothetical protein